MRRQPLRRGFSRVELLAVFLVICLLVALVLPAIQAAREAARRTQCNNNLKNIALGLQNYHDTYKVFPMGAMHSGPNPGGDPPINAALGPSWWYGIQPFTQCCSLYDRIARTQRPGASAENKFCADALNPYLASLPPGNSCCNPTSLRDWLPDFMRCPSSALPITEASSGPLCLPSYAGIAGGCDIDPDSRDYQPGLVSPRTNRRYQNEAKGISVMPGGIITSSGMLPACEHVSMAECLDGTSNTVVVGEQSDWLRDQDRTNAKKYHGDAGWTVGGTGPGGGWLSGTARVDPVPKVRVLGGPPAAWGADCWNITAVRYPPNCKRVMGASPLPGCSENHGINNPLQSPHPGGLLVSRIDGSVQFISEDTDLAVLLRRAIRNDLQDLTSD